MSGMSGIVYNSKFNNDFSANKLRHTYVKGYVDISGGDLNLQNGAFTMYNGKTSGAYFSIQNDGKFWINSFGQFMSVSLENLKLLKDISIEGPSLGDLQIWTQGIRHDTTMAYDATDATEINRGGLTIKGTRFKSETYAVFLSDVSINGNLNVNNDVSFNSRLFVGRDVSLGQKLFLKDDASFNSNLFVGRDVSFGKRLYLVGDASFNSNLFVGRDVSLGQKLFVKNFVSIGKSLPLMSLDISYADGIRLPTGTTNERPIKTGGTGTGFTTQNGTDISVTDKSLYVGTIRYNTTNSQFEGFGPGNSWGSLGGVINVAQNTKIVASSPNADSTNNELMFFTAPNDSLATDDAKERMRILANGDVSINSNLFVGYDVSFNSKLFVKNFVSIGKSLPLMSLDISYADGIRLPTGTTDERPIKVVGTNSFETKTGTPISASDKSMYVGAVRYNTTNSQFEGFGPGDSWGSLGGVINVAQNTKILASSPNADSTNNELMFFTAPTNSTTTSAATERMRILANGDVSMNNKLSVSGDVSFNSNLTVAGNVKIENTLTFKKLTLTQGGSSGSPIQITPTYSLVEIGGTSLSTSYYSLSNGFFDGQTIKIVSINFDSSTYSLQVSGTIRLDSLNNVCSPVVFKTTCQSFDAVWINNAWIVTAYTGVNFTGSNIMFGTSGTGDIQLNAASKLHVNSHSTITGDVSLNSNLFVAANVGIGQTNPATKLHVNGSTGSLLTLQNDVGGGGGSIINIDFRDASHKMGMIQSKNLGTPAYWTTQMSFFTAVHSETVQEAMRITGTSVDAPNCCDIKIFGDVESVSYNAVSDYRIKENIMILDASFNVDVLNPVTYNLKSSGKQDIGFIAHEVQEFYPYLVNGVKDGPETQSLNYNGLIGILTKEIKDLKKEMRLVNDANTKLNSNVSVLREANAKLNDDFSKLASELSVLKEIVQDLMPL